MEILKYTYDKISGADDFSLLQLTAGRKLSEVCHTHDFYEIILVADGEILHEINGREHKQCPGDYVVLSPGDYHRVLSQKKDTSVVCLSVKNEEFLKFTSIFTEEKYVIIHPFAHRKFIT